MANTMVDTKMLQEEMKNHGYTIEGLATKLGKSRTCVFNKIHNKSEFTVSEIYTIAKVLKIKGKKLDQIFFATRVE